MFPEIICTVLRGSYEIVCFVSEGDCASDLMKDRSHEHTAQIVIGLIAADFASILKGNFFKAIAHHVRRCESSVNLIFKIPVHSEVIVGAIDIVMASRWVMRGLLHEALGTILTYALVSFAEDGVEWLVEYIVIELPREGTSHE